jgi:hypothetical protein
MWGLNIQGDWGPLTFYTATNKDLIAFLKAPPRCPETQNQRMIRDRFVRIGLSWADMTQPQRDQWEAITRRANLRVTGFNLFTYWQMRRDTPAIATLEAQTNIPLYKPTFIDLNPEGYEP